MRIFTLPPAAETPPEPNFYDSMKKIRLRQQLEMYSIGESKERGGSPGPVGFWGRRRACLSWRAVGTPGRNPPALRHHARAWVTGLRREEVRSEGAAVRFSSSCRNESDVEVIKRAGSV